MLIGWLPRAAVAASWSVLALLLFLDLVGEFALLGQRVLNISPYAATFGGLMGLHSPSPPF